MCGGRPRAYPARCFGIGGPDCKSEATPAVRPASVLVCPHAPSRGRAGKLGLRTEGLVVRGLLAGGAAEACGLRCGDAIERVDGQLATPRNLQELLAGDPDGVDDAMCISVVRGRPLGPRCD